MPSTATATALQGKFFDAYDAWVASRINKKPSDVVGFLSTSRQTGAAAQRHGFKYILDVPICHWLTGRSILEREEGRWGDYAAASHPYHWSPNFDDRYQEELEMANVLLAGSEFVMQSLVEAGVPPGKIKVVPYGVDTAAFKPPAVRARKSGDNLKILSVGKIDLRKGVLYSADALAGVTVPYEWKLIGGMGLNEKGRALLARANAQVLGHIPKVEVGRLLQWADVVLFPTTFEGSSLAIYEAMACGVPCITTRNCGSVITDGHDGTIIQASDVAAIRAAISRAFEDPDELERLGVNAATTMREYTWSNYCDRLLQAIAS